MSEVAEAAEAWPRARTTPEGVGAAADEDRVAWAVAHAAVQAAEDLGVAAIVCPTQSGTTARRVAAFRPSVPIAGIATQPEVLGRLASRGACARSQCAGDTDDHEAQLPRGGSRACAECRSRAEGRLDRGRVRVAGQARRRDRHRARRPRRLRV